MPNPGPGPAPSSGPTQGTERYDQILQVFTLQAEEAKADSFPFGQAFVAVQPQVNAGYGEGYFGQVRNDGRNIDAIPRPLIHAVTRLESKASPLFANLYSRGEAQAFPWDPTLIRRVTGFVFSGRAVSPEKFEAQKAVWSSYFRPSKTDPGRRRFQDVEMRELDKTSSFSFNLKACLFSSIDSGFVSMTRSIHVARHFALAPGVHGKPTSEGYVYVAYVRGGWDGTDRSLKSMHYYEQEVAVPGMVPFNRVVAYRKILRDPGAPNHSAPAEFVGPIYVRDQLQTHESEAYQKILQALSVKSLFTKRHEEGADWKTFQDKMGDKAYRDQFRKDHPKPSQSAIWGN